MNELEAGARHGAAAPRGLPRTPGSRGGRFTRLFPFLPACDLDRGVIDALVERLRLAAADEHRENHEISAGFTYLGQFIDHDLTFDATSQIDRGNDPHALANFRTPRLDLDSLYGSGPADQPYLYDWSDPHPGVRLLVGLNPPDSGAAGVDLPRNEQGRAIIGDARNDEHLIIAQLHLLFIKFHNRVVHELHERDGELTGNALFDAAYQAVQWHYQWIVTHDHLAMILGDDLWKTFRPRIDGDVRAADRAGPLWDVPAIPVEFSGAVYRFGHSMVRQDYPINPDHAAVPILPPANPQDGLHLGGFRRLPRALQIHWPSFFGPHAVGSMRIDHRLTRHLYALAPDDAKLARLNLERGQALGLPSGRDVALAMGEKPLKEVELYPPGLWPAATQTPARAAVLASPPLWFYVLREAVAHARGAHLGRVGGRIVAEVLIGLLEADRSSYLNTPEPWTPAIDGLPSTMAELVAFALREG